MCLAVSSMAMGVNGTAQRRACRDLRAEHGFEVVDCLSNVRSFEGDTDFAFDLRFAFCSRIHSKHEEWPSERVVFLLDSRPFVFAFQVARRIVASDCFCAKGRKED